MCIRIILKQPASTLGILGSQEGVHKAVASAADASLAADRVAGAATIAEVSEIVVDWGSQ